MPSAILDNFVTGLAVPTVVVEPSVETRLAMISFANTGLGSILAGISVPVLTVPSSFTISAR